MAELKFGSGSSEAPGQRDSSKSGSKDKVQAAAVPGKDAAQRGRGAEAAGSLFETEPARSDFGPDYDKRRIRFRKSDEVNPYADAQDERYGLDARATKLIVLAVAVAVVFMLVCILPLEVFDRANRPDSSIGTLAAETASSFVGLLTFVLDPNTAYGTRVLSVMSAVLAGAAMGLSGGVFQGSMKNPLASPSTLGVNSGGTIGVIIFAVFMAPHSVGWVFQGQMSDYGQAVEEAGVLGFVLEMFGPFMASLLGCIVVVALVMLIALAAGRGKVSNASLIIAGQVFTATITVVITWIREYLVLHGDATALNVLVNAQTSTFTATYTPLSVAVFAVPLLACMAVIFAMSGRLSLLAFSDDEARSMGISTLRTRNTMVAVCTVMTALVIAFCGAVGFVGFMVPHIARKVVGPDFRYLLPACALIGGVMVCTVFYVSQLGIPGIITGSTGVITSVVGCIAFLVMALRTRGHASGEWL